jgi:hypothetical protein
MMHGAPAFIRHQQKEKALRLYLCLKHRKKKQLNLKRR